VLFGAKKKGIDKPLIFIEFKSYALSYNEAAEGRC